MFLNRLAGDRQYYEQLDQIEDAMEPAALKLFVALLESNRAGQAKRVKDVGGLPGRFPYTFP